MPGWVPWALALQIGFAFLVPPFGWGNRTVFPSDLWCFAWVALGMAQVAREAFLRRSGLSKSTPSASREFKPFARYFVGVLLVVVLIYAHGYFRPSLRDTFKYSYFFKMAETDLFQPGRELVVALRFLSWLWGCGLVCWWYRTPRDYNEEGLRLRALVFCMAIAGLLILIERLSPSAARAIEGFYLANHDVDQWRDRAYGPFRSPVEASTVMMLGALLVLTQNSDQGWKTRLRRAWVWGASTASLVAVILAKSASPLVVASALALKHLGRRWNRKPFLKALLWSVAGLGISAWFAAYVARQGWVLGKMNDLLFRFGPWRLYVSSLCSRWDYFLFGFGFAPYHTDNSYLFVLNRGGILAFGLLVIPLSRWLYQSRAAWGLRQRVPLDFLLLMGLVLDAWIYRHVVTLLFALVLPRLALRSAPETFLENSKPSANYTPSA